MFSDCWSSPKPFIIVMTLLVPFLFICVFMFFFYQFHISKCKNRNKILSRSFFIVFHLRLSATNSSTRFPAILEMICVISDVICLTCEWPAVAGDSRKIGWYGFLAQWLECWYNTYLWLKLVNSIILNPLQNNDLWSKEESRATQFNSYQPSI